MISALIWGGARVCRWVNMLGPQTFDAVLERRVLGGVDERVDKAVHLQQDDAKVVERKSFPENFIMEQSGKFKNKESVLD